jgi:hypothetical protein
MKKFVLALAFMVLLGNARAFADTTQTFNAYGAALLPNQGAAILDGSSVAFPALRCIPLAFILQCSLTLQAIMARQTTNCSRSEAI